MVELSGADRERLLQAIALAERCPATSTFKVGAVVTDARGEVLATGYSGQREPHEHAEEAALVSLPARDPKLHAATMYSSLEPCSTRAHRSASCTRLILDAGIARVVFAWREPALFVDCEGAEQLRAAGCEVVEVPELAGLVRATNSHLPGIAESGER